MRSRRQRNIPIFPESQTRLIIFANLPFLFSFFPALSIRGVWCMVTCRVTRLVDKWSMLFLASFVLRLGKREGTPCFRGILPVEREEKRLTNGSKNKSGHFPP